MSISDPILVYVSALQGRSETGVFLRGMSCGAGDLVSRALFRGPLMLQVVVTVLTHSHGRGDLQPLDLRLEATAPEETASNISEH